MLFNLSRRKKIVLSIALGAGLLSGIAVPQLLPLERLGMAVAIGIVVGILVAVALRTGHDI